MPPSYPSLASFQRAATEPPKITFKLDEFLDIVLSDYKQYWEPPESCPHIAEVIKLLDPEEIWTHIQYPGDEYRTDVTRPVIWRKKWWVGSYGQWKQERAEAERRRQERYKLERWEKELTQGIMRDVGLEEDDATTLARAILDLNHPNNNLNSRFLKCKLYGVAIDAPSEEQIEAHRLSKIVVRGDALDCEGKPMPTGEE